MCVAKRAPRQLKTYIYLVCSSSGAAFRACRLATYIKNSFESFRNESPRRGRISAHGAELRYTCMCFQCEIAPSANLFLVLPRLELTQWRTVAYTCASGFRQNVTELSLALFPIACVGSVREHAIHYIVTTSER